MDLALLFLSAFAASTILPMSSEAAFVPFVVLVLIGKAARYALVLFAVG